MNLVECFLNEQWPLWLPDFRAAFWNARPKWERGRLEHCAATIDSGWTVFDIGAEHGDMTSLYKSWVGSYGDVIPVEPSAHYWPFIRTTWEANFPDSPSLNYVGFVGNKRRGKRPFNKDWPSEASGEGIPDGGFQHIKHDHETSMTTIDDLSLWKPADAIIIDIEGAEYMALEGAEYTLRHHRPHVWVSVHDVADGDWSGPLKDWYGRTADDVHLYMESLNYRATELPWNGEGEHFWFYSPR